MKRIVAAIRVRSQLTDAHPTSIGVSSTFDRQYVYHTLQPAESHAPIANSKPMSTCELSFERFDIALASFRVASQGEKDAHRSLAVNAAKL